MHVCVRAQMYARLNVRACMYATDGMERLVDLNVFMCVCACARPCLHACDPMGEDGMIAARLDG